MDNQHKPQPPVSSGQGENPQFSAPSEVPSQSPAPDNKEPSLPLPSTEEVEFIKESKSAIERRDNLISKKDEDFMKQFETLRKTQEYLAAAEERIKQLTSSPEKEKKERDVPQERRQRQPPKKELGRARERNDRKDESRERSRKPKEKDESRLRSKQSSTSGSSKQSDSRPESRGSSRKGDYSRPRKEYRAKGNDSTKRVMRELVTQLSTERARENARLDARREAEAEEEDKQSDMDQRSESGSDNEGVRTNRSVPISDSGSGEEPGLNESANIEEIMDEYDSGNLEGIRNVNVMWEEQSSTLTLKNLFCMGTTLFGFHKWMSHVPTDPDAFARLPVYTSLGCVLGGFAFNVAHGVVKSLPWKGLAGAFSDREVHRMRAATASEVKSIKNKWFGFLPKWGSATNNPAADLRSDAYSLGEMKHKPSLTWVIYEKSNWLRTFSKKALLVSPELVAQIKLPNTSRYVSKDIDAYERIDFAAQRVHSVNIPRQLVLDGHNVSQDSVLLAYGLHKQMIQNMDFPFPKVESHNQSTDTYVTAIELMRYPYRNLGPSRTVQSLVSFVSLIPTGVRLWQALWGQFSRTQSYLIPTLPTQKQCSLASVVEPRLSLLEQIRNWWKSSASSSGSGLGKTSTPSPQKVIPPSKPGWKVRIIHNGVEMSWRDVGNQLKTYVIQMKNTFVSLVSKKMNIIRNINMREALWRGQMLLSALWDQFLDLLRRSYSSLITSSKRFLVQIDPVLFMRNCAEWVRRSGAQTIQLLKQTLFESLWAPVSLSFTTTWSGASLMVVVLWLLLKRS